MKNLILNQPSTKTVILFLLLLFAWVWALPAKQACKVKVEALSGSYSGDCRRGLAHGQGFAEGVDQYQGRFRNGLPHGQGTYIWANGNYYQGQWRNGLRHGQGAFFFEIDGEKVEQSGVWRNGEFIGETQKAGFIPGHIINLKRYSVNRTDDGNMVLVTYYTHNRITSPPRDYLFQINSGSSIRVGQSAGFEDVIFPATINITYTHEGLVRVRFEATINEPGIWEIKLYN